MHITVESLFTAGFQQLSEFSYTHVCPWRLMRQKVFRPSQTPAAKSTD